MCCRSKHNITLYWLWVIYSSSQLSTTLVAWRGKSSHPIVCSKTHKSFASYRGCANFLCIVHIEKEGKKGPVVHITSVNRTNNQWRVLYLQYPYIQRSKVLSLICKRQTRRARRARRACLPGRPYVLVNHWITSGVEFSLVSIWALPPNQLAKSENRKNRVDSYLNISDYM